MPVWGNHSGGNVALARGTEQLLLDMALNPEWVKRAARTVSGIHLEVRDGLWEMVVAQLVGVEGSLNYGRC